jgi:predicted N-acetyltransferase YhbS
VTAREVTASGLRALGLATELLQRARRADPDAGTWEAADRQWWWRTPRRSDDVDQVFWVDDGGPVAGALLSSWSGDVWQCDPVVVPGAGPEPDLVWARAMAHASEHAPNGFDVPVRDDDTGFLELARGSGLTAGEQDSTAWMDAADRPAVVAPADGFTVVDRARRRDQPHPMQHRSGEDVARRLEQVSLYDPQLDLAVVTDDGDVAGYSLYWADPVTGVGLVEPVRVEDDFQRRGLARAMLTAGIDRLVARGARRVKISYRSEAAGALYAGLGFGTTGTTTWYQHRPWTADN